MPLWELKSHFDLTVDQNSDDQRILRINHPKCHPLNFLKIKHFGSN